MQQHKSGKTKTTVDDESRSCPSSFVSEFFWFFFLFLPGLFVLVGAWPCYRTMSIILLFKQKYQKTTAARPRATLVSLFSGARLKLPALGLSQHSDSKKIKFRLATHVLHSVKSSIEFSKFFCFSNFRIGSGHSSLSQLQPQQQQAAYLTRGTLAAAPAAPCARLPSLAGSAQRQTPEQGMSRPSRNAPLLDSSHE